MAKKSSEKKLKGIEEIKKDGKIVRYKIRCRVGRDEHRKQVWKTMQISADDPRIDSLTPARLCNELNEIKRQFARWDPGRQAERKAVYHLPPVHK